MSRWIGDDYVAIDYRQPPPFNGPPVRDQLCRNGHLCQIDIAAITRLFHHPLVMFCRECGTKIFEVTIYKPDRPIPGPAQLAHREETLQAITAPICPGRDDNNG